MYFNLSPYGLTRREARIDVPAGTWAVLTYVRQDRWVDDPGSLDMDIKRCSHFLVREEGNHTREEGWYLLRGLESAMLSFDFRSPRGVRIHSKSQQRPPIAFSDGHESRRRRERARKPRKHVKPPLRRRHPPGPQTRKFTVSEGASLSISDREDHRLRAVEGASDAGRLRVVLGDAGLPRAGDGY